jgi:Flp pilus assembly protein TadD
MGGDPRGAVQQFREVLRSAPPDGPDESVAKANYSLGVLMMSGGRFDQAVADYATAYADKTENDYERVRKSEADDGRLTPRTRS